MERCRSHPVWEARTDFGSVGVIDNADQMPTTPRHRGGRCESGLSEIKRFGVGASLFERNENRVHISDALLISPECPVPAGASRPAGTPVPSAQLLEPHSSASPPVLLHCVHHGIAATQLVRALSPGVCVSLAHAAKAEMAGVRAGPDGVRVKLDPAPCWLRKRSSRASNAVWS